MINPATRKTPKKKTPNKSVNLVALKKRLAARNNKKKVVLKTPPKEPVTKAKAGRPKKNEVGQLLDNLTGKFRTGRPPTITGPVLQKLAVAFAYGSSDQEACAIAGISPSTLYSYQEKNKDFMEQKECLKNLPTFKARKKIVDAINNEDGLETAKWWITKKRPREFGDKPSAGVAVQVNNFKSDKYFEEIE